MDDLNISPIKISANVDLDLTKTTNDIYNDALKKPIASSSNVIETVVDFFHNTILYPLQKYNIYAKNKLENYANRLQEKAKKIPEENLIQPKVNILGPVMEGLKYNLDEEHIKEMFTNILLSDMDSRKQSKVKPAYIEIVKQLSKEDAEFLMLLKKFNGNLCSISINVQEQDSEGHYSLDKYIIYGYKHDSASNNISFGFSKLNSLVIDNLIMHRLIEQDYQVYYTYPTAKEQYTTLFNQIKKQYKLAPNHTLIYDKGIVKLTSFGENFIDICLS